jgi:hypothetical protein
MLALRYAPPKLSLVACPFCRELFERSEAKQCPVCGLALSALEKLPLSHDAAAEDGGAPTLPEQVVLPLLYAGRARLPLAVCGLLGIGLFFGNWLHQTLPYDRELTGFELAKGMGWTWAVLAAWMVLVPIVLSRRTILAMRRARVAATFLAFIPAVSCAILLLRPPSGRMFTIEFEFNAAFWVTLVLSVVATLSAIRFGGRLDTPTE